jgi:hypothetical protein
LGNFGGCLSGGALLILECVILVLSQIDVLNFGTLRNRWYFHFVDNPFIERKPDFYCISNPSIKKKEFKIT